MKAVNVHQAKTRLSKLLAEVEKTGERISICRNGKPVADLVPHQRPDRMLPHPVMRGVVLRYDPTEALTPDEWPETG